MDELFELNEGSCYLFLDETFSEALNLVKTVFSSKNTPVVVATRRGLGSEIGLPPLRIPSFSLTEMSISLNSYRSENPGSVLIHEYLSSLVITEMPDLVLRMVIQWKEDVTKCRTSEIYLLPRNAFPEFERKMMSIVDGVLVIKAQPQGPAYQLTFMPIGSCKPEYNLREFPFRIETGRLLVKMGPDFTDRLVKIDEEALTKRIEYYTKNLDILRVSVRSRAGILSPGDTWLLSQVDGQNLLQIKVLFSDIFDELVKKLAKWELEERIVLTPSERQGDPYSKYNIGKPLSLKTRLALQLPFRMSRMLISKSSGGKVRSVPADVYAADRKAALALASTLTKMFGVEESRTIEYLLEMERLFQESVSRTTFIERLQTMGENVLGRIDISHLPKITRLTLALGYNLDSKVVKRSGTEFEIRVPGCYLCRDLSSDRPLCTSVEGGVVGACAQTFKMRFSCREATCKAMGDDSCTFILKRLEGPIAPAG